MSECIFCKIIAGEIPSKKVYSDELCYAFYDIAPQAPTHILIIPREYIASVAEITHENAALFAHMLGVTARLAAELGLKNGYRVITNCGPDACQSVSHLHFHLLGGKKMSDKMA